MGTPLRYELRKLIEERKLLKIKPDRKLVTKEMKGAEYDLRRAQESLDKKDTKWATVQAYYSMFHAARALLYSKGYREKSHTALRIALKELFEAPAQLDSESIRSFEYAMDMREEADYRLEFSESSAIELLDEAKGFLEMAKQVLRIAL